MIARKPEWTPEVIEGARALSTVQAVPVAELGISLHFGVPVVSLRADGSMWVIDGQHRVAAT